MELATPEGRFVRALGITPLSTDAELDALFLADEFSQSSLVKDLSVANLDDAPDQELYLQHVEKASARLKTYMDQLRDQIVSIVEKQSDGFLEVAQKLDGFKQVLAGLKHSNADF